MDPFQLAPQDVADLVRLGVVIVYALLTLDQVVLVVPLVDVDRPVVHLHHRIAHPVKEIAVVRDHEEGAARVREVTLQILDGVRVEVVRGLVHDEELRLRGEHLRQRHALDLASGQVSHALLPVQAEVREDARDAEPVLEETLLIQAFGEGRRRVHYLCADGLVRVIVVLLLQEGYPYLPEEHDAPAGVGLVLPGEDAHQRGLAGAVGGDEGDLVAFVDIEADVLEQDLRPVRLGDVLYLEVRGHYLKNLSTSLTTSGRAKTATLS